MRMSIVSFALAVTFLSGIARAFPPEHERVQDRLWGESQRWVVFNRSTSTDLTIRLTGMTVSCLDPISGRYPADWSGLCPEMCPGGAPVLDLYVHLFEQLAGEIDVPMHCTASGCEKTFELGAVTPLEHGIFIHSGLGAAGRVSGTLEVLSNGTTLVSQPIALADNIMVDVSGPPLAGYEVHSVLVPDGPDRGRGTPGNAPNDNLGVDATEAWLLGSDMRIIWADTLQSGVGAAAFVSNVTLQGFAPGTKWIVVRPWSPLPSGGFQVYLPSGVGGGLPLAWADGSKSPTVGRGRMRVIVNDLGDDWDGDTVSTAVEVRLGTCDGLNRFIPSTTGEFTCITRDAFQSDPRNAWMDPRDTDGDGLSDRAEIFGLDYTKGRPEQADGACADSNVPLQWIEDADQTFPLWGFNPRHKDMLLEVDMAQPAGYVTNGSQGLVCLTGNGCSPGTNGSVLRPMVPSYGSPPTVGFIHSLDHYVDQLNVFRGHYARIHWSRAANPDRLDGIEVHFDVEGPHTWTEGHGWVRFFDARGEDDRPLPGLIAYHPPYRSGSTCRCGNAQLCPSPRHAGLSHYIQAGPGDGGGQSSCNNTIIYGFGNGTAGAHETGHHLGLLHGGPINDCGDSPFGYNRFTTYDVTFTGKLAYHSIMNYSYVNYGDPNVVRAMPFSDARNHPSPLPRAVGGTFGFPEEIPVGGNSTAFMQYYTPHPTTPAPTGCEMMSSPLCVDADFSGDGNISGVVTDALEAADGAWFRGRHRWIEVPGYWCPEEARIATVDASLCCDSGSFEDGACRAPDHSIRSSATNLAVTNTMLLAASPAVTTANGRLYAFYVDDLVSGGAGSGGNRTEGDRLPRRCVTASAAAGYCTNNAILPNGRLRWAAVDGFEVPSTLHDGGDDVCYGEENDCTKVVGNEFGTVLEAAPNNETRQIEVSGTTQLAAATVNASGQETVFLAWATRPTFACAPNTDNCRDSWGPLQVRSVQAGMLETGAFQDITPTFPTGHGAHIAGVALVAWDPATTAPTKALLFAREARGLTSGGGIYYTVCDPVTGCQPMTELTDATSAAVVSYTAIAAAVDHPPVGSGAEPSVSLLYGTRVGPDDSFASMRVLRVQRGTGGAIATTRQPLMYNSTDRVGASFESGVSIAFADSTESQRGRMMTVLEYGQDRQDVPYYVVTGGWPYSSTGNITVQPPVEMRWSFSRPSFGFRALLTNLWTVTRADGPGHVPTFFFDERTGISSGTRLAAATRLERNVRVVRTSQEQSGPALTLTVVTDSRPADSHFDYDDTRQLAHNVCRTIAASSRGILGPDMQFSPLGALRCPGGLSGARSSAMALHLAHRIRSYCQGACLQSNPPTRVFDEIASLLVNPALFSNKIINNPATGPLPPTPIFPHTDCIADRDMLVHMANPGLPQ